tara:strand:+ start:778 stop:1080 length:303 start_codon:yes stop_codon:yes gene_type:complete
MENSTRKKRGRPAVNIQWPDVEFTAQDVVETLPTKISRVTIHSKLNQAVDSGKIKVIGAQKSKNGRPRVRYIKVTGSDLTKTDPVETDNPTQTGPASFLG